MCLPSPTNTSDVLYLLGIIFMVRCDAEGGMTYS
jgi:hypothetical protein